jgi:hypothetical protein
VLLAARLSMSFPLLFSAVPLHVILPGPRNRKRLIEVWLADGGITSNFPVHLFDAYVPKHPTFCLNLVYQDVKLFADEGPVDEPSRYLRLPGGESGDDGFLYMPNDGPGDTHFFTRLRGEKEGAAKRIGQFLGLVFDTSLAWNDNLVMDVPGYRDRIIHIWMDRGDGGFNFDMTPDQIMELDRKGRVAGRIIAERFLPGQYDDPLRPGTPLILGWLNHRRDRLATFLDARTSMEARFADQMELVKDLSRQDARPTASDPAPIGEGEAHQAPRRRLALRMRPLLDSDPRATRPNKAGSTRRPS